MKQHVICKIWGLGGGGWGVGGGGVGGGGSATLYKCQILGGVRGDPVFRLTGMDKCCMD
jgi:hypothetical protein